MRQGREHQVDCFQLMDTAKYKAGSFAQIGMQTGYRLADKTLRGTLVDLHLRVLQKQPQQFPPAIS
jgi:hypothetical protein